MATRLLLVEDDARLSSLIAEYLAAYEFEVAVVARGDEALARFRAFTPDVVVLDLMLPGMDGADVCRQLRALGSAPILVLTAREDDYDQVALLEHGADDFINKPVQPRVLLARLRALLRRAGPAAAVAASAAAVATPPGALQFGALCIATSDREVRWRGAPVVLTGSDRTAAGAGRGGRHRAVARRAAEEAARPGIRRHGPQHRQQHFQTAPPLRRPRRGKNQDRTPPAAWR